MRYERMLITPGLAEQWLSKLAPDQRAEKKSKIPMYARDMKSGNWDVDTGQTIKFNTRGELIDGQNRLRAVILADVAVEFDVAWDVPVSAMRVLDIGAARTAADVFKISGTPQRFSAAAIVRWIINWDTGNFMNSRGTSGGMATIPEVWDRYHVEPLQFDAASARGNDLRHHGLGASAASGTAYMLFSRIDQEQTHMFFDHLISGADLAEGHPILTLRNKLIRSKQDRLRAEEHLVLMIRGWNAFRRDEKLHRILISLAPLSNKNFPQPK